LMREGTMALRDKLRERARPLLEPGEKIEEVFLAQNGSPWMLGLGGGLLMLLFAKPRVVVVTDRAVVLFRQSKLTATPTELLARLPRTTQIGPVKGLWAKTVLSGEQIYIHRRFHGDVKRADAELAEAGASSSGEPEEAKSSETEV
jgi:hypothetical protein